MKKVIALFAVIAFVATAAFAADTAATSTAAGTTATTTKAASLSLVGKIVSFKADASKKTAGTLVVVDNAKKKHDFVVENTTTIADAAKKPAKVKDLAKNKTVTVEYTEAGKVLTAVSITL